MTGLGQDLVEVVRLEREFPEPGQNRPLAKQLLADAFFLGQKAPPCVRSGALRRLRPAPWQLGTAVGPHDVRAPKRGYRPAVSTKLTSRNPGPNCRRAQPDDGGLTD